MQTVPTLDLSLFVSGSPTDRLSFAKEFVEALRTFGFVRLRNHTISSWTLQAAFDHSRELFALPRKTLDGYIVPGAKAQVGYTPPGAEKAIGYAEADLKMSWSVSREGNPNNPRHAPYLKMPNVWPKELPGLRGVLLKLYGEEETCAALLMRALELGLDLPDGTLTSLIPDGDSLLRPLFYFSLSGDVPAGAMRSAPHRDSNLLSLLPAASAEGLVIESQDEWILVGERLGEVVVNVGDMLSRLTNGYLRSTRHGVMNPPNPGTVRYAIPYFVHGHPDAVLHVPDRFRGEGFPEPPSDITCGECLQQVLRQTIDGKAA